MLKIALQSKGRLNEESLSLLASIGINVDEPKRKFISKARNFDIETLFLRDDDIPLVVASGTASLGIVGLNEVAEKGADVEIVKQLGFGGCRISLAIPKADKYEGLDYFRGKRIATSYPRILKDFLDKNGIEATIEIITGSVEIAPAAGIADCIFDIVSSGSTLVSNGLVEVERVFESEAVLIANKNMSAQDRDTLEEILFRIDSHLMSSGKKYLLMNIPTAALDQAVKILPAMRSPTVMPLASEGWCSLHSVVEADTLWEKVRLLKAIGAEGILVIDLDKIIL
ncbi:MAG: ATP phosphoribosyltransferase [Bacteroidales bacterium]|nr:ATP phosphoribosyltransferase [Bacteroidales bacterium]MBR4001479.1 ATP phosphoribosyltransferase [Bacteroidales bacterium]